MGSGGVPPYRLLVLPNGPTPLSSGVEVRRILDVPFPEGSRTVSFKLKYPAFSQLVAVVSITMFFFSSFFFFFCSSHFCYVFGVIVVKVVIARILHGGFLRYVRVVHIRTPPFTCFMMEVGFYVICSMLHTPPFSDPCSVIP